MGGKGPLAAPRGGHVGAAGLSPAPRGVLGSRELQDPAREGRGAGAALGPRKLSEAAHLPSPQLIGRSESCDGGGRGRAVPQGPPWPPQRPSPHRAPGLSRALFLGLSRLHDTQVTCSGRTSHRGGVSGRVATKSTHRAAQEIGGSQWAGTPPRPAESRCLSAAVAVAQGAEALPPLWGAVPRTFPPPGGSTRPRGRLPGELGTPRGGGGARGGLPPAPSPSKETEV